MTTAQALQSVLAEFDNSPTALAAAVGNGVKRQNVEYWIVAGHVPAQHCPGVERAVKGKTVCEELSPEGTRWVRIPDKAWPWHKKGRPALDVTKAVAA